MRPQRVPEDEGASDPLLHKSDANQLPYGSVGGTEEWNSEPRSTGQQYDSGTGEHDDNNGYTEYA